MRVQDRKKIPTRFYKLEGLAARSTLASCTNRATEYPLFTSLGTTTCKNLTSTTSTYYCTLIKDHPTSFDLPNHVCRQPTPPYLKTEVDPTLYGRNDGNVVNIWPENILDKNQRCLYKDSYNPVKKVCLHKILDRSYRCDYFDSAVQDSRRKWSMKPNRGFRRF